MTLRDEEGLAEFLAEYIPDPTPPTPRLEEPPSDDIEVFLDAMVVEAQAIRGPRVTCVPLTQDALAVYHPRSPYRGLETARELLARGPYSLADVLRTKLDDAPGCYALYYQGDLETYALMRDESSRLPMYLGSSQTGVVKRLQAHCASITQVGLGIENFTCRLVALPLDCVHDCEGRAQRLYGSLWDAHLKGFGSRQYAVDQRAATTTRSIWDTLHPGRIGAGGVERTDGDLTELVKNAIEQCLIRYRRVERLLAADQYLNQWDPR